MNILILNPMRNLQLLYKMVKTLPLFKPIQNKGVQIVLRLKNE